MLYSRANRVGMCVQDLVHVVRDAGAASFPPSGQVRQPALVPVF